MDQQIISELAKDPERNIISLLNTVREQSQIIDNILAVMVSSEYTKVVNIILPDGRLRVFAIKEDGAEIAWADIDYAHEETAVWQIIEVK